MNQKFLTLTFIACVLTGCSSDSDDIEAVKSGVYGFNKAITVGQALDNWRSCKETSWRLYKTDNGAKVVQYICNHKIEKHFEDFRKDVNSSKSKKYKKAINDLDITSIKESFKFMLNLDGSSEFVDTSNTYTWSDKSEVVDNAYKNLSRLQWAYRNNLSYAPNDTSDYNSSRTKVYNTLHKIALKNLAN